MSTTYVGTWEAGPIVQVVDDATGERFELTPARARRLRPAGQGFGWGYVGAGPHTLALALLLDATGEPCTALELFEAFTLKIRDWPVTGWSITGEEIEAWAAARAARCEGVTV